MKNFTLPLIIIFAFMLLVGGGCNSDKEEANKETTTEIIEYDSNWTSEIDKSDIATTTEVDGTINEKEIDIVEVQIKKWNDEYSWSFSDMASDEACGVVLDNSAVNFSSIRLETGTFEKKMEENVDFNSYHAYYHYEQEDGTPMSINVEWSAKIVVEEIDIENNKVRGYAKVDFEDGKSMIDGMFEADLCE